MTDSEIKDLELYIDDLLDKLNPKDFKDSAINYADLNCFIDNTLLIIIEEASPDSYELRNYIAGKVREKYPNLRFRIVTEW